MNQILFTETKKNNSSQDTKKIVLFFAITIIIFGIILLGQGAYAIYSKSKNKEENTTSNAETNIQLQQLDNGEIQVNVESKVGISELIYSWNNNSAETISENGKTTIQETIEAKPGENDLIVKTIDLNGKQITKHEKSCALINSSLKNENNNDINNIINSDANKINTDEYIKLLLMNVYKIIKVNK